MNPQIITVVRVAKACYASGRFITLCVSSVVPHVRLVGKRMTIALAAMLDPDYALDPKRTLFPVHAFTARTGATLHLGFNYVVLHILVVVLIPLI